MRILNLFKKKKDTLKLRCIFVGQDGTRFYTYNTPTDIPISRTVAAEAAIRIAEWGLSKQRLRELVNQLSDMLKKNEPVDKMQLFAITQELSIGLESLVEEEALFGVAAALILMDDEPTEYDSDWTKAKVDRWKRRPDERNFFLQVAWSNCKQFAEHSSIDILSYLQQIVPLQRDLPFAVKRFVSTLKT